MTTSDADKSEESIVINDKQEIRDYIETVVTSMNVAAYQANVVTRQLSDFNASVQWSWPDNVQWDEPDKEDLPDDDF